MEPLVEHEINQATNHNNIRSRHSKRLIPTDSHVTNDKQCSRNQNTTYPPSEQEATQPQEKLEHPEIIWRSGEIAEIRR